MSKLHPGPDRCLGVVHIPKCGGSAVRSALAQLEGCYATPLYFDAVHFGTEELRRGIPEPNSDLIANPDQLAAAVSASRLVVGHYSADSLLSAGCAGLAVQVREPRSRILSLYRFWEGQSAEERAGWGMWGSLLVDRAQLPLAQFLACPDVWPAIDNGISRQLLGVRRWRRYPGRPLEPSLMVVEWSSQSTAFVERIADALGAAEAPTLLRENVTSVAGESQVIDRSALARLRQLTRFDRRALTALSRHGHLTARPDEALEREFHESAERLGFRISP
ncbi:MAG: hypothetical protein WAM97_16720 [Acidimicrobiales bacterium]